MSHQPLTSKERREFNILLGLVKLYLETGKPIGSNTLKENAFDRLSSATIRNYFSRLEKEGYLTQQHASGGRIPTQAAYKLFANEHLHINEVEPDEEFILKEVLEKEGKDFSALFQESIAALAKMCRSAIFLSSPRFDQDFIVEVKLVNIDEKRCLCVIITDFGMVHTEILYTQQRMSLFATKRVEEYFRFRLTGLDQPTLSSEEEIFAKEAYNEIVLRHFVMYTNFNREDVYRCGFHELLAHPEFYEPIVLTHSLAIFENTQLLSPLLRETLKDNTLKYWIGDDLAKLIPPPFVSSIITIPYSINQKPVGTIAVLGPDRQQYGKIFSLLKVFSQLLSETLTTNIYKYQLSYRQPHQKILTEKGTGKMIENQSVENIRYEE